MNLYALATYSGNVEKFECSNMYCIREKNGTKQLIHIQNMVLVDYIGIFFYMWQYFWPHTL